MGRPDYCRPLRPENCRSRLVRDIARARQRTLREQLWTKPLAHEKTQKAARTPSPGLCSSPGRSRRPAPPVHPRRRPFAPPTHFREQLVRARSWGHGDGEGQIHRPLRRRKVPGTFRKHPLRFAPPILGSAADSLSPFAEHPGRQLGSPPQHHQSRRQGKVRTPLPTTSTSWSICLCE